MKQSKITFLVSIGACLEHYDLVIYSLLASFISKQFFPNQNQTTALFATFGVYVFGSMVRPLGGIIFGIIGDRFGRKTVFTNTLFLMACVTFLMGLIPTFATAGLTATILFATGKVLQGVIFGAEVPGALTFLSEHINKNRHGLHFGFMTASSGIGVSLAAFVIWILTKVLTEAEMLAWGFRIPFLLGGSLALVGFCIRKHIPETPAFLAAQKAKAKLTLGMIKEHIWKAVNVVGVLLFPACFVIFFLFLPVYLHNAYNFAFSDVYLAMTCGYIWSSFLIPVFGWISDVIDRKLLIILPALIMIVFGFPVFALLRTSSCFAAFVFVFFGQTLIAAMSAAYFVLIPQAFQTSIRYTGTAFCYNIAYMIAAMMSLVVNYIYTVLKQPGYVLGLFVLLAVVTIISTLMLKIRYAVDGS